MTNKRFFFLFLIISTFFTNQALAATRHLNSAEVKSLLTNRTFTRHFVKDNKTYQIYFAAEGEFRVVYPSKTVKKSDKWSVKDDGKLCLRKTIRKSSKQGLSRKLFITKCGNVVLDETQKTLLLYDDDGSLESTFRLLGRGNLVDSETE
ncbi:MAG: hypothetical protein KQH63_07495 [Desulfobulbaceae bacterium]|nr:hypothetical protein [Desulfobulbaceae bacterium]